MAGGAGARGTEPLGHAAILTHPCARRMPAAPAHPVSERSSAPSLRRRNGGTISGLMPDPARPMRRRSALLRPARAALPSGVGPFAPPARRWPLLPRLRAARRLLAVVLWTLAGERGAGGAAAAARAGQGAVRAPLLARHAPADRRAAARGRRAWRRRGTAGRSSMPPTTPPGSTSRRSAASCRPASSPRTTSPAGR